jgi:sec-independent protein translocase protein TatA
MGLGGISIWQLLVVLAIVITIFGASRLRSLGTDLGRAVRSFRQGLDSAAPATRELPLSRPGDTPGH